MVSKLTCRFTGNRHPLEELICKQALVDMSGVWVTSTVGVAEGLPAKELTDRYRTKEETIKKHLKSWMDKNPNSKTN